VHVLIIAYKATSDDGDDKSLVVLGKVNE